MSEQQNIPPVSVQDSASRNAKKKTMRSWVLSGVLGVVLFGIIALIAIPALLAQRERARARNASEGGATSNAQPSEDAQSKAVMERFKQGDQLANDLVTKLASNSPGISNLEMVKAAFKLESDPYVRVSILMKFRGASLDTDTPLGRYIPPVYFEMASAFALSLPPSVLKTQFIKSIFKDAISEQSIKNKEIVDQYKALANNPEEILKLELISAARRNELLKEQNFTDFLASYPSGDPAVEVSNNNQATPVNGMNIEEAKRILTSEDLYQSQLDMTGYGYRIENLIGAAIVHGQIPTTPSGAESAGVKLVKAFVSRMKAEQYLSINDPNFSKYSSFLNEPTRLNDVLSLIEKYNYGSYLKSQKIYSSSEIAESREVAIELVKRGQENDSMLRRFRGYVFILGKYLDLSRRHNLGDLSNS
jgi:hypothetical protein